MNWTYFNTYNEAPTKAFEAMCNQLFELWCKREYGDEILGFSVVNGSGGDGGVEAFATLKNGNIIAVQSKWFPQLISYKQIKQIDNSIRTALYVRPNTVKYIVCIPRDLTSLKKINNGSISKKTESCIWDNLKTKIAIDYPNLELILWPESKIQMELQYDDAAGINRFWFDKVEISKESIEKSFYKQECSWLNKRYVPNIHCKGIINDRLSEFLGNKENREAILSKLLNIKLLFEKFNKSEKDYLDVIVKDKINEDFKSELLSLEEKINSAHKNIKKCIDLFKKDISILNIYECIEIEVNYDILLGELKKYYYNKDIEIIKRALKEDVESLYNINLSEVKNLLIKQNEYKLLLIIGERGTGKTHGVADYIKNLLTNEYHTGILVQASSINKYNTWKDILVKTLGLSENWAEDELYSALEAYSYRKEVNVVNEFKDIKITSKILICIDGIDESLPYKIWINRLRECYSICKNHSRLRFCITSRPYAFEGVDYKDELKINTLKIPPDGDVPVENLFDEYINEHNVEIENKEWIKWSLKTPLALKLFCQCYEGKKVKDSDKVTVTITKLLEKNIERIDKEFIGYTGEKYSSKDYIVKRLILILANYFTHNRKIERGDLYNLISNEDKLRFICSEDKHKLIEFVANHGILHCYTVEYEDFLSTPDVFYSVGMNSFFEYVLAINILHKNNNIDNVRELMLPNIIKDNSGVLQMIAIMLLEDYETLLSDIKWFVDELTDYRILNLIYFTLINVTPRLSRNYVEFILNIMKSGRDTFIDCVNKVIIPVSRFKNHPLGASLLNRYLISYELPYQRDIVWSMPEELVNKDYQNWLDLNTEGIMNSRYKLNINDKYDGLPIIYAWNLTTVDNHKRIYCRKELTKWGSISPTEFYKLLDELFKSNDPQMQEDLMAIAMGIVYSNKLKNEEIEFYGKWVIQNIFSTKKISEIYDAAIRYYGRAIAEYSFKYGYLSEKEVKVARPPYFHDKNKLNLNKEALAGTRMGGYKGITYDLSRYVLCDPITNSFFDKYRSDYQENKFNYEEHFTIDEIEYYMSYYDISLECREKMENILKTLKKAKRDIFDFDLFINGDYLEDNNEEIKDINIDNSKSDIDEFLKEHANSIGEESVTSEQYIISTAYNYLLETGWVKDVIIENDKKERKPDSLISGRFIPATHGQKSKVMTLVEKYIWCARNVIYGYLADRLTFKDDDKEGFVSDYGLIDDFPNTNHEIEDIACIDMRNNILYLPEILSPTINIKYDGYNNLMEWINNTKEPNFEKWINIDNNFNELYDKNLVALYSFTSLSDKNCYGESLMWISSGIINNKEFTLLIKDIDDKRNHILKSFERPEDIKAFTKTQCYITPKEICCMNWKKQLEGCIYNSTINNSEIHTYEIIKTVEECTANYDEIGDVNYKLPSKYIRDLLKITDVNNNIFIDANNNSIGQYYNAGDPWRDCTILLGVNKEKLYTTLEKEDKTIFWIIKLLREASSISREKYDIYKDNEKVWICWYEGKEFKTKLIEYSMQI